MPSFKDIDQVKDIRRKMPDSIMASGDFEKQIRMFRYFLDQSRLGPSLRSSVESLVVPDESDTSGLLSRGSRSAEFHRSYLRDSYTAEPGDAVRDEDELNPGKHKIVFKSLDGRQDVYRNLKADDQNWTGGALLKGVGVEEGISESDDLINAWKRLKDPSSSSSSRVSALGVLSNAGNQAKVAEYLAEELARADRLEPDWRDAIIYMAEDCHFPSGLHELLGETLWGIASSLSKRADVSEKVVWSALRRGSSLLSPCRVEGLIGFLEPGSTVDIRSVALQCVIRMLEIEPPASPPSSLADMVYRFSVLFLDPYVFCSGEASVIARNSVAALASVGDARLNTALVAVRTLNRSWLTRRLKAELARILQGWIERGISPDHPAVSNLKGALESFT